MIYAVLADIHSNIEALQTAVDFLAKRRVDTIYCLGDVVGYGPDPNACCDLLRELKVDVVMGNHDVALTDDKILDWFNTDARKAIEWTRSVLKKKHRRWILKFPYIKNKRHCALTHGSFYSPESFHYLYKYEEAQDSFDYCKKKVGWYGHTHLPQMFIYEQELNVPLDEGDYELVKGFRYQINPGSVGQPRDGDLRLAFAIFDTEKHLLEMVRLKYDWDKTAEKILQAGLPSFFAERLLP